MFLSDILIYIYIYTGQTFHSGCLAQKRPRMYSVPAYGLAAGIAVG